MSETYEINESNRVVPYTSGRKCTDTRAWRDATELELQQQEQISQLERELAEARKQRDTLAKTLMCLHDAADAFAADQSEARDERCGLVQSVTVAECENLNQALKAAWELLNQST